MTECIRPRQGQSSSAETKAVGIEAEAAKSLPSGEALPQGLRHWFRQIY